jgi:Mn-containing catalase
VDQKKSAQEPPMFFRQKQLAYNAKPDKPDPLFAKMLQEPLGGQWGEISVMMTYLFQGWNCRGPAKYRDMIMDIGTEEIGHVEMLATMIARLLETSPIEDQEEMAKNSIVGAVMGGARVEDAIVAGMNAQHYIVAGLGARPADSVGNLWNAGFMTASGNLLADFRFNVTAESQGRLQVARLYNMTNDAGVRDMLSFLIARDTMHQNQWLAAIAELEADGLDATPGAHELPAGAGEGRRRLPLPRPLGGNEAQAGRWAKGAAPTEGHLRLQRQPAALRRRRRRARSRRSQGLRHAGPAGAAGRQEGLIRQGRPFRRPSRTLAVLRR